MKRLFVFEGHRPDITIFKSMYKLFFNDCDGIAVRFIYKAGFHKLFKQLKENDMSLFRVLQELPCGKHDDDLKIYNEADFSEIFLFFDYDFQNIHVTLDKWNAELREMLEYFNEETENGKMYINYPMVESIRYTKELPDNEYYTYTIDRQKCIDEDFKKIASSFSFYKDLDFILHDGREFDNDAVKNHWKLLIEQNVKKANYICNNIFDFPKDKLDISQDLIFDSQCEKYVGKDNNVVSILNSFPIFLYDYFKFE